MTASPPHQEVVKELLAMQERLRAHGVPNEVPEADAGDQVQDGGLTVIEGELEFVLEPVREWTPAGEGATARERLESLRRRLDRLDADLDVVLTRVGDAEADVVEVPELTDELTADGLEA